MGEQSPNPLSEQEALTLAVRYEAQYSKDPIQCYQELVTLYGREGTKTIVKWMEDVYYNCNIDQSAGLAEDFDPKEAA